MMIDDTAPCERCGAQAPLVTVLAPIGNDPGRHVYQCPSCNHLTMVSWQPSPLPVPQTDQPVQQQQQQQQTQPKKADDR